LLGPQVIPSEEKSFMEKIKSARWPEEIFIRLTEIDRCSEKAIAHFFPNSHHNKKSLIMKSKNNNPQANRCSSNKI